MNTEYRSGVKPDEDDPWDFQVRYAADSVLGSKASIAFKPYPGVRAGRDPETEAGGSRQPLSELSVQVTRLVTEAVGR